jgi:predicted DNA-binding transcriptional regulator AlpA
MLTQHGDGVMTPVELATTNECEFVSIPEWCGRVGCSLDTGYRAARRNEIPGLFRIGRLVRVNWGAFVASTTLPEPLVPSVGRE